MLRFLKNSARLLIAMGDRFDHDHFLRSEKRHSTAVILGNGPSLNADLEKIRGLSGQNEVDFYCVNSFPISPLFLELKPRHLVLADTAYWDPQAAGAALRDRDVVLEGLGDAARDFPVTVYLPYQARQSAVLKYYLTCPNVELKFYRANRWMGPFKGFIYRRGLAMPTAQNVLIAAIYICLLKRYKINFIFGADHSWPREMKVDEQSRLYFESGHFYAPAKAHSIYFDPGETKLFRVSDFFAAMLRVFRSYDELADLARRLDAEVLNASHETLIDSFRRKL